MVQVWLIRESKTTGIASYFEAFESEVSAKDGLKLRCENVKLFLREPLPRRKKENCSKRIKQGCETTVHPHAIRQAFPRMNYKKTMSDPIFKLRAGLGMKHATGIPQVFDDANDIDDDPKGSRKNNFT